MLKGWRLRKKSRVECCRYRLLGGLGKAKGCARISVWQRPNSRTILQASVHDKIEADNSYSFYYEFLIGGTNLRRWIPKLPRSFEEARCSAALKV